MALSHAVAKAVLTGLFTVERPFLRTPKCEDKSAIIRGIMVAWEEFVLFSLLWLGAVVIAIGGYDNDDALTWVSMLIAMSLPYGASLIASFASAMPSLALARAPKTLTMPIAVPAGVLSPPVAGVAPIALPSVQASQSLRIDGAD